MKWLQLMCSSMVAWAHVNYKCQYNQAVKCPGTSIGCKGNQCCRDGSTCPSASSSFHGCPHGKKYDCLSPLPAPRRRLSAPVPARRRRTIPPSPAPDSFYEVASGDFDVPGYKCGDHSPKTLIFYPKASGKFPVVVYGHGTMGGVDGNYDALGAMASAGFTVIAPYTKVPDGAYMMKCSLVEWQDMLSAVWAARDAGPSLHPALANADFDRIGVWGYSMGAKTSARAAREGKRQGLNIRAVYLSHGARNTHKLHVPTLFETGSADVVAPAAHMLDEFGHCVAKHKIFANLKKGSHTEPQTTKKFTLWGALFMSCHVRENQGHCHRVYGGELCAANEYEACIVQQPAELEAAHHEVNVADAPQLEVVV